MVEVNSVIVDNINELIKLIYPSVKTSELPILNAKSIFSYGEIAV